MRSLPIEYHLQDHYAVDKRSSFLPIKSPMLSATTEEDLLDLLPILWNCRDKAVVGRFYESQFMFYAAIGDGRRVLLEMIVLAKFSSFCSCQLGMMELF